MKRLMSHETLEHAGFVACDLQVRHTRDGSAIIWYVNHHWDIARRNNGATTAQLRIGDARDWYKRKHLLATHVYYTLEQAGCDNVCESIARRNGRIRAFSYLEAYRTAARSQGISPYPPTIVSDLPNLRKRHGSA